MNYSDAATVRNIGNIPFNEISVQKFVPEFRPYQNKISNTLAHLNGVSAFSFLNDDIFNEICDSERGVIVSGGMEYDNRALDACYQKDALMCIFCDGLVEEQKEISMVMMDDFGNITGNDVPLCMMDEYRGRKDVIWLSENFVLYTKAKQLSESRIVMLPRRFHAFSNLEGISDPICFYPNITSDVILKNRFLDKCDPNMCSLIIGFDYS